MYSKDEVRKATLKYFDGDELATSVWIDKYAHQKDGVFFELNPDDMHRRMAREFARIEASYPNPQLTEDEIYKLFKNFQYIVPQGRVMAGLGITDTFRSLSNCLVLESPLDSYSSIMRTDTQMVNAAKRGCGYGVDLSNLRPKGSATKNAANTSTGIVPFMERYSNSTREVGQNSRRGACLLGLDISHPEALSFANAKHDKTKITGANISLKLTDDFFMAVESDSDFDLVFNGEIHETIRAKDLWDVIIKNAHENAEPGIFMWDTMNFYDPVSVYPNHKIVLTNACVIKGTLVNTPLGLIPVENLNVGDHISTVLGVEPINKIESHDSVMTYEVKFSDGGTQFVTADHIYHVLNGKKVSNTVRLQDISVGDYVRVHPVEIEVVGDKSDYTRGLKTGILLGDGGYSEKSLKHNNALSISTSKDDTVYNENLISLFDIIRVSHDDPNSKSRRYWISNADKILNALSLTPKKAPEKYIPKGVLLSQQYIIGVLDGLLATDGNVNLSTTHPQLRWDTSSKQLANDIRNYLLMLGIHGRITESNSKGGIIAGREIKRNFTKYTVGVVGVGVRDYYDVSNLHKIHLSKAEKLSNAVTNFMLTGNTWKVRVVSIKQYKEAPVYDLYCQKSDTWITEGYVQRGCGEQPMSAYDTCRLITLNLYSIVIDPFTPNARLDLDLLYDIAYKQQRLGDNLVDLELEYIDRILGKIAADPEPESYKVFEVELWEKVREKASTGRRTGSGLTGLGDMLAAINIEYGSEQSLEVIREVMSTKLKAELTASIDLAIERGQFPDFNVHREYTNGVPQNDFYEMLAVEFPELTDKMMEFGRRNINWSTIAPVGSVSLLTRTTSGCEPVFQTEYVRRRKVASNPTFVDANGDMWEEYVVYHPKYEVCKEISDVNPYVSASEIDWVDRLHVQAILQRYTSSAISSTVNLPQEITPEDVSDIYLTAWDLGLKGITIYRDGSRSGVLISGKEVNRDAPKRPTRLDCKINNSKIQGINWVVLVGMLDNVPFEVFAFQRPRLNETDGVLIKRGQGKYDLEINGDIIVSDLVNSYLSDEEQNLTRLISLALRHGVKLEYITEQLSKSQGSIVGFGKVINRTLRKFAKEVITKELCPECDSPLVMSEGCHLCTNSDCSYTGKCG